MTKLLTLDFETYFAPKYSLSLMPTLLYVRDPRFKVHGCAIKHDSDPAVWVTGSELEEYFTTINWDSTTVVAHNALFDGLVLAEQYGHHPAQWIDTAGLARAILPPNVPADLATLAAVLRLGAKGQELKEAKGVVDLPPDLEERIAGYAINDSELAYKIQETLYPYLPQNERDLLSLTIHWGTKSRLKLNRQLIKDALHAAKAEREALIQASGYTATELRSAKQFPEIVRSLGIEPPTKLNDKGETAFALAANDLGFIELQARYPEHRALWDARIAANSNSTVNRLENFYNVTKQRNTIVMPLNYCGARHTMRWSGAGKLNMQNLERGSATRLAIEAQDEDEVIVVVDSSQIELRMNAWFCNQESSLEILRTGQDIYSHTATAHFGYPVTKKMPERQFGKALELALGYGMGWPKFQTQAAIGIMGTPPVQLTDEEAQNAVTKYRDGHNNIKTMWRFLNDTAIPRMAQKDVIKGEPNDPVIWKCVSFTHQTVHLPNGLALEYPNLEQDEEGNWWYEAEGRQKLYGAKLLENCLAEDTEVLTDEGWKPIQTVQPHNRVWDGTSWVEHDGLIAKGEQPTIELWGVHMTPDHKVLTPQGWTNAATSQNQGLDRATIRLPDGPPPRPQRRDETLLDSALRLRDRAPSQGSRPSTRPQDTLRLSNQQENQRSQHQTRANQTPALRHLDVHESQVPPTESPRVQELRSPGDHRTPTLARVIPSLLGRHVADLQARAITRPNQQQRRLHAYELPVGRPNDPGQQPPREQTPRDPLGTANGCTSSKTLRRGRHHAPLPAATQLATGQAIRAASGDQQVRPVYDLLNTGPNHCFTVRGRDGEPFLAHNCIQALARVVVGEQILAIEAYLKGFAHTVSSTHDEALAVCHRNVADYVLRTMIRIFSTPPSWAPDLPLAAEGGYAHNYSK